VFIAADFPVPELREHPGMTPRRGRIETTGPAEKPGSRQIPCIFPADQGSPAERRVRNGLVPPPFSLRPRRLPARTEGRPGKSPRFRGPWPFRFWRSRTGDCGFRAWKTPQSAFVSVAELGGSVSLPIRLSGRFRRGPKERHPVCRIADGVSVIDESLSGEPTA
jgi:hypothetical protein